MLIFREMFFNIIVTVQLKKQRIVDIEMVDFFLENENCKKLPPSPGIKFGLSLICVIKVFSLLDKKVVSGYFLLPHELDMVVSTHYPPPDKQKVTFVFFKP